MKKFVIEDLINDFKVNKEIDLWAHSDSDTGVVIRWMDISKDQGILITMDKIFEGMIYDDEIECNPEIYPFANLEDKDCIEKVRTYLEEYFECEGFEYNPDDDSFLFE